MRRSPLLLPLLAIPLLGAAPAGISLFRHAQPVTTEGREIDGKLYVPAKDVERLIGDAISRKRDFEERPARAAESVVTGRTPSSLEEIERYKGYASADGLRVKLVSYIVATDEGAYHYGFQITNDGKEPVVFHLTDDAARYFLIDSDENYVAGYTPEMTRDGKDVDRLATGETAILFVRFDDRKDFGPYRTTARLAYDRGGKRIVQPFVFYGFERKVEQP